MRTPVRGKSAGLRVPAGDVVPGALLVEAPFLSWQARDGWVLLTAVARLVSNPSHVDLTAARLAGSTIAGNGYPTLASVANAWKPAGALEAFLFGIGAVLVTSRAIHPNSPDHTSVGAKLAMRWFGTDPRTAYVLTDRQSATFYHLTSGSIAAKSPAVFNHFPSMSQA